MFFSFSCIFCVLILFKIWHLYPLYVLFFLLQNVQSEPFWKKVCWKSRQDPLNTGEATQRWNHQLRRVGQDHLFLHHQEGSHPPRWLRQVLQKGHEADSISCWGCGPAVLPGVTGQEQETRTKHGTKSEEAFHYLELELCQKTEKTWTLKWGKNWVFLIFIEVF